MKTFGCLLTFCSGLVLGGLSVWRYKDKQKEQEIEEVRNELKSYFEDKLAEETEAYANECRERYEGKIVEMQAELTAAKDSSLLQSVNSSSNDSSLTETERMARDSKIYIIRPDEYGTAPDYARFRYIYYPDEDRYENSIVGIEVEPEEVFDLFGHTHPMDHFGEFDDSAVFLRNENIMADIAIYLADDSG